MANSYLNKTFSGAPTNAKKGTVSMWFKLAQNDSSSNNYYRLFVTGADGSTRTDLNIVKPDADVDSNDKAGRLLFSHLVGGNNYTWRTDRQLRDMSAFYHVVVAYDTTQASASDRVKIYINGVQDTALDASATIPQDTDLFYGNNSSAHHIGNSPHYSPRFFQGYMSHFAYVDGTALAPTVFGETESTSGIWKFKSPSGVTWGNNGVHLKFENSGNLSSGNTHNFTVNGNLKQAIDNPSNVYSTLNGANEGPYFTGALGNGNLSHTNVSAGNYYTPGSTLRVSSGKWYVEFKCQAATNWTYVGVDTRNLTATGDWIGKTATGWGYLGGSSAGGSNSLNHNNSQSSYGDTYGTGDIIGIALDLDNKKLYFSKNGTWQNSGVPTSGSTGTGAVNISTIGNDVYFGASNWSGSYVAGWDCNFGNGFFGTTAITSAGSNGNGSLFEYDVPSGYYALNTKNINTYG